MLYIHIPFCKSRCIYCDFFSTSGLEKLTGRFVDALIREMELRRDEISGHAPRTIYIGGGTPSFLPQQELIRIFAALRRLFSCASIEEFTIEVNPDDVTPELLGFLRKNGVNRISMGVQSFNDAELRFIRRRHSAAAAENAIRLLKDGAWNYSVDLIYGLPGQSFESWKSSIGRLLEIRPPHFSAYLLSYEEGTPLSRMEEEGKVEQASEELVVEMYSHLISSAREHGYSHYEISNFAIPAKEARHNSRYWTSTPYCGLGPGASSFNISGARGENPHSLTDYIDSLLPTCHADAASPVEWTPENEVERFNSAIITSLRTSRGLPISSIPPLFHESFTNAASRLIEKGLLTTRNGCYVIPETAWLNSNPIFIDLMEE